MEERKIDAYTIKAIVTKIQATSRVAVKIRDNFYTVEYMEERVIPDVEDVHMDVERQVLFDAVNAEVDRQVADIVNSFQKK